MSKRNTKPRTLKKGSLAFVQGSDGVPSANAEILSKRGSAFHVRYTSGKHKGTEDLVDGSLVFARSSKPKKKTSTKKKSSKKKSSRRKNPTWGPAGSGLYLSPSEHSHHLADEGDLVLFKARGVQDEKVGEVVGMVEKPTGWRLDIVSDGKIYQVPERDVAPINRTPLRKAVHAGAEDILGGIVSWASFPIRGKKGLQDFGRIVEDAKFLVSEYLAGRGNQTRAYGRKLKQAVSSLRERTKDLVRSGQSGLSARMYASALHNMEMSLHLPSRRYRNPHLGGTFFTDAELENFDPLMGDTVLFVPENGRVSRQGVIVGERSDNRGYWRFDVRGENGHIFRDVPLEKMGPVPAPYLTDRSVFSRPKRRKKNPSFGRAYVPDAEMDWFEANEGDLVLFTTPKSPFSEKSGVVVDSRFTEKGGWVYDIESNGRVYRNIRESDVGPINRTPLKRAVLEDAPDKLDLLVPLFEGGVDNHQEARQFLSAVSHLEYLIAEHLKGNGPQSQKYRNELIELTRDVENTVGDLFDVRYTDMGTVRAIQGRMFDWRQDLTQTRHSNPHGILESSISHPSHPSGMMVQYKFGEPTNSMILSHLSGRRVIYDGGYYVDGEFVAGGKDGLSKVLKYLGKTQSQMKAAAKELTQGKGQRPKRATKKKASTKKKTSTKKKRSSKKTTASKKASSVSEVSIKTPDATVKVTGKAAENPKVVKEALDVAEKQQPSADMQGAAVNAILAKLGSLGA